MYEQKAVKLGTNDRRLTTDASIRFCSSTYQNVEPSIWSAWSTTLLFIEFKETEEEDESWISSGESSSGKNTLNTGDVVPF